jgi:twitching motility two-component system response regulator PilH
MSLLQQFKSIVGKKTEESGKPTEDEPTDRRRQKRTNAREGTRVLIIDDSPTIVAALTKILRSAK